MVNIRELSVGSFVTVKVGVIRYFVQVAEILRNNRVSVIWLEPAHDSKDYIVGKIYVFPLEQVFGVSFSQTDMERFGFTESDEKGWQKVYWFGMDMKLLYRYDKRNIQDGLQEGVCPYQLPSGTPASEYHAISDWW